MQIVPYLLFENENKISHTQNLSFALLCVHIFYHVFPSYGNVSFITYYLLLTPSLCVPYQLVCS